VREWLTAVVFGLVFVASVVNQFGIRRWAICVARLDRWTFLPFWAFFAPDPAYAGIHVLFRDRDGAEWTDWAELKLPGSDGWRWFWNPGRHERKALHDLLNGLSYTAVEVKAPAALALSSCHLGILAWVVSQPRLDLGSQTRQFALVQAVGHGPERELQPVFVSSEFSLG
jgi:hypothetical protein